MFPRFSELHQSMEGQPFPDGALEGLFIILAFCVLCYLIPVLSLLFLIRNRLGATRAFAALGVALPVCFIGWWVVYNPIGIWYILLPIVAPGAFVSYLQFDASRRRLYLRRNPNNLIPFRPRRSGD